MIVLAHVAWRLSSLQLCTFLHWFRECVQHATFESQCRCHQLSRVAEIQAQHRIRQCIGLEDFAEVTKYLTTQLRCASVFFEAILHLKLYKFGANPRILIYNNETKLHTISKDYTILTDCVVQTWRVQGLHKTHSRCQSQITQEYYVAPNCIVGNFTRLHGTSERTQIAFNSWSIDRSKEVRYMELLWLMR